MGFLDLFECKGKQFLRVVFSLSITAKYVNQNRNLKKPYPILSLQCTEENKTKIKFKRSIWAFKIAKSGDRFDF